MGNKEPITKMEILAQLLQYKVISIVGLEKNVGKTTTLNYIIELAQNQAVLGLTSIGRDGEAYDAVFEHAKPRIFIPAGTIIATARSSLLNSDITREILEITDISTPLGEIIIARALSAGFVELAGPSTSRGLQELCSLLEFYKLDLILVDGAVDRKSFASPTVTKATILATGANLSTDFTEFIEETIYTYYLLTLPEYSDLDSLSLARSVSKLGIITDEGKLLNFSVSTSLDVADSIIDAIPHNPKVVVVNGVLSQNLVEKLLTRVDPDHPLIILVLDSTKIFLPRQFFALFKKTQWRLSIQHPINLILVTANPVSPRGYTFEAPKMLEALRKQIAHPVIDVVGGG